MNDAVKKSTKELSPGNWAVFRDRHYEKLCETANKIEYLSGYSLDDLLERLAAGWTLQPPEPDKFSLLRMEE